MFDLFKKGKIKKEIAKEVNCLLSPSEMDEIVNNVMYNRIADHSDLYNLYKAILRITAGKTGSFTRYYAKGLPSWMAIIPPKHKALYLNVVKQFVLKKSTQTSLIAETLPSLLLKVEEINRTPYLEIILFSLSRKISSEQELAEIMPAHLKKLDQKIVGFYFKTIHESITHAPSSSLRTAKEFMEWVGRVPGHRLSTFLSCIEATMMIAPVVASTEAQKLSHYICRWDDETVKKYHGVVVHVTREFADAGKTVALYLPQLIESGSHTQIETYENIISEVLPHDFDLGKTVAKHLPGLFIYGDDKIDRYKRIVWGVAAVDLPMAISVAGAIPQIFHMGDDRLIELYVDTAMDSIRQMDNTRRYRTKIFLENLPVWTARIPVNYRQNYILLMYRIASKDDALIESASEIIPELLQTLNLGDVNRFIEQGLDISEDNRDKAIAFFSLSSKTAQETLLRIKNAQPLREIAHTLRLYATAHGSRDLHIKAINNADRSPADIVFGKSYTDGKTIYLPGEIYRYPDKYLNFRLYKLITAIEASQIEFGTYNFNINTFHKKRKNVCDLDDSRPQTESVDEKLNKNTSDLDQFFEYFSSPALASDLFKIFELGRVSHLLFETYKGLKKEMQPFILDAFDARPETAGFTPLESIVELLCQMVFWGKTKNENSDKRVHTVVRIIYEHYREFINHKCGDVYQSSYLTQYAFNIIMEIYSAEAYGISGDFNAGNVSVVDIKHLPEINVQVLPSEDTGDDPAPMHDLDEEDPETISGKLPDNVIQDNYSDSDKDDPAGIQRDEWDQSHIENYKPLVELPFQGDIRPDVVQLKEVELTQALNTLKKKLANTKQEALKKEINDLLKQKKSNGPTFSSEEILPLVKGENLERLLLGCREKALRLTDLIKMRPKEDTNETLISGENVYYYNEWDTLIRDYRLRWVTVYEKIPDTGNTEIISEILNKNSDNIRAVKHQFERLNPEGMRKLKRQFDGDDLDIDAVTEAVIDLKVRCSPSDRLYIKRRKRERSVSVAFLIDLSNSTSKKIDGSGKTVLDVERESLIVMAEALEAIGDQYAIYGFSGRGRHHCAFYIFKDFFQPYTDTTKDMIGGMIPLTSTRLGPALRHSITRLNIQEGRAKLLIFLTDGRPVDNDHYDDQYAREDTKMALREAKRSNIHPYCITIDEVSEVSNNYFDDVYGDIHYTVIRDVASLPTRLPGIYRKMTR